MIVFDEELLEKIKGTIYSYKDKIPAGIRHYYKEILSGENIYICKHMICLAMT